MSAPVLDVEILTENVEGSILRYEGHLESLVALYASCHGRIDTFTRTGRCKRDEAENVLPDLIDRQGQLLLSRRVLAASAEARIPDWALRDARELLGLKTKRFYPNGTGRGSVTVWLLPAEVLPDPGHRKAGTSR